MGRLGYRPSERLLFFQSPNRQENGNYFQYVDHFFAKETSTQKLFKKTFGEQAPTLFLYDVTSSYLEGDQNELGDWGYNRDKKRGKKQIVVGLLCGDDGTPVSVRVFKGNTTDLKTFGAQIEKTAREFGCQRVTMAGRPAACSVYRSRGRVWPGCSQHWRSRRQALCRAMAVV